MDDINQSPLLEIYNFVFKQALELTSNVYDYRPDASIRAPFIFVSETFSSDKKNYKLTLSGDAVQTVNIYGSQKDRHILMSWLEELSKLVKKPTSQNYKIIYDNINTQVLTENVGTEQLLRIIIDIDFKYYK